MNVVHLITRLIIGGAQENTLHTVEDQHHLHGDQVTLITGPAEGPEGSLLPRAAAGGFPVEVLPELVRSIRPTTDWQAYRRLIARFRELRPDIVHTHSSKAGIVGRAAAHKLGIPVVHTIHGASFHYGQSPLAYHGYIQLERLAARWTDRFISVADDMSQEYLRAGIATPDRYETVYSGFDVEPFLNPPVPRHEVRRRYGIDEQTIVVGKIGRLFHLKGHEFLIKAAPAIVAQNPRVKFLLVGDGILRQTYEREIASQGLTDHFIFTGLVQPGMIPELMAAMDLVVHTSQWEGLARVLPQGLIAGKPVVSYDVGGAREVVIPGETGFLLPRDSLEPLIDAVLQLAGDAELRARYGAAGRERCARIFRHQYMTEQIRKVYEGVLASRTLRGGSIRALN
ncbi:glycosyltransferase family 4 protein [Planctomicrobium sp. SH664]|uniref:glycosyltransferase family 4 protein n=1 Tax=Planctomicrobium sp. SH664 TaxID=3448125 RepID=UPI003F5B1361